MFTRSVISFSGKSAIVSAILPGMLFVAPAAASQLRAEGVVKTADTRRSSLPQPTVTKQGKKRQRPHADRQPLKVFSLGAFTLRAYTQYASADEPPNKTATGTIPVSGRTVAVDPRIIPFGTKIYIEGLGERVAEDSGASIKGRQLDIFLPTVEHCRTFGVQTRDVKIMPE